ncbi:MAG TPA: sodium transporter, partial [Chryseosolibacter sp.]
VLYQEGMFHQEMVEQGALNPDRAYPVLLNLLPVGLKGLAFAALTAAIVASLAGKANSISTIFTLDIYKKFIRKDATEKHLVIVGRIAILFAMIIAGFIAPFMGIDKKGGFQYIQEYTGFVSPGIFAIFILGFFWKRTTAKAALTAAIITFPLSLLFKFLPAWVDLSWLQTFGFAALNPESAIFEIPFIDRMLFVFLIVVALMVVISVADPASKNNPRGLEIDSSMFKPQGAFAIGAAIVCAILALLYFVFW